MIKILTLLTCVLATSCSVKTSNQAVVTACATPADQALSFAGKWSATPISLSIDTNSNFTADEITAIQNAVNAWNTFFKASKNIPIFGPDTTNVPMVTITNPHTAAPGTDWCLSAGSLTDGGSTFTGPVVIYKTQKPNTLINEVLAVTYICQGNSKINNFTQLRMAVIEVYISISSDIIQDYFQTAITHELGHVIGLNHSCDTEKDQADYISCSDPNIPNDYIQALMYYALPKNISRGITANDQGRSNCLY